MGSKGAAGKRRDRAPSGASTASGEAPASTTTGRGGGHAAKSSGGWSWKCGLGSLESYLVIALLMPSIAMYMRLLGTEYVTKLSTAYLGAVAVYFATCTAIWRTKTYTARAGLWGKDICKKGSPAEDDKIPEALGIVCGVVFVIAIIIGSALLPRTPMEMASHNGAITAVVFMVLLGFGDDVLDIPWRYKLFLPAMASIPLLCSYTGSTSVIMPVQLRPHIMRADGNLGLLGAALDLLPAVWVDPSGLGAVVHLGWVYYVYMALVVVFCTHSINIYAGCNGLEAGQALVIGCAILFTNLLELSRSGAVATHLLSALFLLPFIATTLGLLKYNWYPSRVFVGDTFCYFAGMSFAVAAVLGHFSKTLLLFFIPQILNFVISVPQLFKFVPCPRHRIPSVDSTTGLLKPSTRGDGSGRINLTLINVTLHLCGPLHERTLVLVLLAFQAVCCAGGIYFRYSLADSFY